MMDNDSVRIQLLNGNVDVHAGGHPLSINGDEIGNGDNWFISGTGMVYARRIAMEWRLEQAGFLGC